jgi:general secretion pathway protein G
MKKNQGFTLIEILVVIVIMGIMAALVVPKVLGTTDDARKAAAQSDIKNIMTSLNLYYLREARFPTEAQGLDALVNKPTTSPIPTNYKEGGYLDKLPNDPWNHPYQYKNPGKHGQVDVYSFGPDGATPAGEDSDKVIGNWQ